eukprot:8620326-Pyramimonas_sp.AAC.1
MAADALRATSSAFFFCSVHGRASRLQLPALAMACFAAFPPDAGSNGIAHRFGPLALGDRLHRDCLLWLR